MMLKADIEFYFYRKVNVMQQSEIAHINDSIFYVCENKILDAKVYLRKFFHLMIEYKKM